MGKMSDLHIEMQEVEALVGLVGLKRRPSIPEIYNDYPPTCLTTETLANEILFHFQRRGVNAMRPDDHDQNALELRNLIQELLDRHMTVFYQP